MSSRLRITLRAWPYFLSGVALTLFMAWAVPLLLAVRGLGPGSPTVAAQRLFASTVPGADSPELAFEPTVEIRRSVFSDWCIVEPATLPDGSMRWPSQALEEPSSAVDGSPIRRSAPYGCVLSPLEPGRDRYGRIDTGLAGWPFRAFASEAWFARRTTGEGNERMPEHRWNLYIGDFDGRQTLVALRPLPLGIAADTMFWSCASWLVVAIPATLRRRKREKYGKCVACGQALDPTAARRPERCPECGANLPRDPLGLVRSPEMHFQNLYTWFVFVSSLDIMLTWKILDRGGVEVNPAAKIVIDAWGMHGAIGFKFALMLWVIVACELLARMKRSAGRFLAICAVVLSASPVAWSLCLLLWHELVPG